MLLFTPGTDHVPFFFHQNVIVKIFGILLKAQAETVPNVKQCENHCRDSPNDDKKGRSYGRPFYTPIFENSQKVLSAPPGACISAHLNSLIIYMIQL